MDNTNGSHPGKAYTVFHADGVQIVKSDCRKAVCDMAVGIATRMGAKRLVATTYHPGGRVAKHNYAKWLEKAVREPDATAGTQ